MLVIGKMLIERVVKRDNGSKTIEREVRMVAMHAGQVMFVKNILGRTIYDLAWVEVLDDGHCRVEFKEDTIITVEGLHPNGWTCENLRFARLNNWDRTAYKGVKLFHNHVTPFGRLVKALLQADQKPYHIVGGARHYAIARCHDGNGQGGEIIVPVPTKREKDAGLPAEDSSHVFIVAVDEIDHVLATLPPIQQPFINYKIS